MIVTHSLNETFALGEKIGKILRPGDTLSLKGELGAGKTRLVHGIARGYLGQKTHTRSPSFTILNIYENGDKKIHHFDLYRLSGAESLESTGYRDLISDENALNIVEWMEMAPEGKTDKYAEISIHYEDEDAENAPRFFRLTDANDEELKSRLNAIFHD